MSLAVISTQVYLIPGMSVKIEAIIDPGTGMGDWAYMGTLEVTAGVTEDLAAKNGFYVENKAVGTITAVPNEPAVIYKHNKPEQNAIWFVAKKGSGSRRGVVHVMSVPIHDHSSIVQGGPAYGTYFSDDDVED